ncbi:MAG: tetratricopeptide repeat protein [Sandaracinaceae bacterium]
MTTHHGLPAPDLDDESEASTLIHAELPSVAALRKASVDLAHAWKAELASTEDTGRKARIQYELGRIYEGVLRNPEDAWSRYEAARELRPEHIPTLRGARRVALGLNNARAAVPLFDAEARITADPRRKAALLLAKGRLLEDALSDPDGAVRAYATASELDRGEFSVLEALRQRAEAKEDWNALERVLEKQANAVHRDPRHRAALIVERARLFEHRLERVDAAIELYESALTLDPETAGALDALEQLCHGQRRWRDLIHVLHRRAEQSAEPRERALALYQVGALYLTRLGDREEAIRALERALTELPDAPLILQELGALLERSEAWERVVEVWTRLAELTADPQERLAQWHRIGGLLGERLRRPAQAREAYERALAIDPTHIPSLYALARLYQVAKAYPALVKMHLAEAAATTDDNRRAAVHARVAELMESHLDDDAGAMKHHARALALRPGYAPSFKALVRLYRDAGRHRPRIELYERAIEISEDPVSQVAWLFETGAIYEDALGEPAQAAHVYRRALALEQEIAGLADGARDTGALRALHALQRASERAARHEDLVEALEAEATLRQAQREEGATDARVVDLLHRAAGVLDEDLDRVDAATERYQRVLSLDENHAPALAALGRLLRRRGRWDDLLDLYERTLTSHDAEARSGLLHEMGTIAEEHIGDEHRAIECYRRALDHDARHRPSLRALGRRLGAQRAWSDMVPVLELEIGGLTNPEEKARAAYRLGEVHEQLEAPDRAAAAYESALAAFPDYPPARAAITRLRGQRKAWRRLVEQLEYEAEQAEAPAVAVARLLGAGSLLAVELDDPRRAVSCYERALEREPTNVAALLGLERLYRKLARHDERRTVCGSLARVLTDPGARITALRELARLSPGEAHRKTRREIFEAITGLSPEDPMALEGLEAVALETGDWALLARVDQRLVATAGDAKIASAYQTRLAESLEVAYDPAALDAFRAALGSDPENIAAAKGYGRTARARQIPDAVRDACRKEANITPNPASAARLYVHAARTAESAMEDTGGALADYERALELWPDDADAAAGLSALLQAEDQAQKAIDRLGRAASNARSPERVASLWMQVSSLQADQAGDVGAALTSLRRVLSGSPRHVPTLRRMAELHGREKRYGEAAELLSEVVSLAPDQLTLKEAHLELARIHDEHLEDATRTRTSLQAVLSLEPTNAAALARLARLDARAGDPDRAARSLRRLVEASPRAERPAVLLELSRVEGERGDIGGARHAALQALAIEGPGGTAAERHHALIETPPDWSEHVDALRAWLESAKDPKRRRPARVEIARIMADELMRPARSVDELERAIHELPSDLDLRRRLAIALRRSGMAEESVAELRAVLQDVPTEAVLWREMASSFRKLGDGESERRALAPIALLDQATGEERRTIARGLKASGRGRARSLDEAVLAQLYPTRKTAALTRLLRHLMPAIGKLYPPDFDAYGLSSRDRIDKKSSDPLRKLAERIASVFGTGEFDLYVHRVRGRGVAVELADPPAIMVPRELLDVAESQLVFALARPLADIAVGLYAFDKLTPRELEIVLAAIARRVQDGYGAGLTAEDTLADVGKRLYKALPRRARKEVDDLARAYVEAPRVDFAHMVTAVQTSGHCIAVLMSDDLIGAAAILQRTERDLANLSGKALVTHPLLARLLRFWISPDADTLRERIGRRDPTRTATAPTE